MCLTLVKDFLLALGKDNLFLAGLVKQPEPNFLAANCGIHGSNSAILCFASEAGAWI
jgi:hypothetical protein